MIRRFLFPAAQQFLRQAAQVVHDKAGVIEYLPPLFRDEPAVDEDGIEQGDLDEVVRQQYGRPCEEGRANPRVHEVLDGVEVR